MSKKRNYKHILFIGLLTILILLFFKDTNLTSKITGENELASMHYAYFNEQRKSILEYHQFPLWTPTFYGGTPLFALPQSSVFFITGFIPTLFIKNLELGLNLIPIINSILGAIFMYMLMIIGFRLKPKYAFISSLVFVFNLFMLNTTISWIGRHKVIMFAPLFLLLCILALRKKNFIKYSILAGLALALQFHGGGVDFFMLGLLIPFTFFLYKGAMTLLKKDYARLKKIALTSIIILLVFSGLAMIKILPMIEFKPYSSKAVGFSYEAAKGITLYPSKVLTLPYNAAGSVDSQKGRTRIGTIALILFAGSFFAWKKKGNIFLYLLLILSLLIATGNIVYYPFWRFIPGFKAVHNLSRTLWVTLFVISMLAGIGAYHIFKRIEKRKYADIILGLVILLLIIDLTIIPHSKLTHRKEEHYTLTNGVVETAKANELMSYLSKQPGLFRVHNIESLEIAGWTPMYISALGLSELMGVASVWITQYLNVYLSIAHAAPAKFWGMLNTKYLYSEDFINESYFTVISHHFPDNIMSDSAEGFKYIRKFDECGICIENNAQDHGVDGPYLYENEFYLPRAILVNHSIGIFNDDINLMYNILLLGDFDPANTVIIMIEDNNTDLNKFEFIIPVKPREWEGSMQKFILDYSSLAIALNHSNSFKEMPIKYYSPNKIVIELDGKEGFLVLAEKYFLFPGWRATINGKERELMGANGINTAIYLNKERGPLIIEYKPKSFIYGVTISLLTLALVIIYFGYGCLQKIKRKKQAIG